MHEFTQDQQDAIRIAHNLADMGVPIFAAHRNSLTSDFLYPNGWQHTKPGQVSHNWIDRWRPGMALCMVTGVVFDVIDVDPRNGGDEQTLPLFVGCGRAATPSAGTHILIPRTHLAKGKPARGIDLQAGADDGTGRGFIFLAPTVRVSRHGPNEGREVAYRWEYEPTLPGVDAEDDPGFATLIELCEAQRAPRRTGLRPPPMGVPGDDEDAFYDSATTWTRAEAGKVVAAQLKAVADAKAGEVNNVLGGAARVLGRFVAGGFLDESHAAEMLLDALGAGGVHSDAWNVAHGKSWTAATCIGAGLANGAQEPWTVEAPAVQTQPVDSRTMSPAQEPATVARVTETAPVEAGAALPGNPSSRAKGLSGTVPPLLVESSATMAYWLQNALGAGSLSGFFLKSGQVVHTPRIDEIGYVAPREGKDDDNGPAQIQAVSAGNLAAKIQYAHRCYKLEAVKGEDGKKTGETREVDALFPQQAAQRAVDAPEAMGMLRPLRGLTHTPMVRADGSILAEPGYDAASGYLFLPGQGVKVPAVPEAPTVQEVSRAVGLLHEMVAGFPFESGDDRANYFGLLLTPLLRLVTPPSYKMFGIGAHQPGSGKTLLADCATILHGGVLRSEMPEDEPEMRKQITSILSTTSAPIVHVDNVTGVLKSPTLAGLLTASQPLQDRELGSSRMIETVNDRVWVVTGNNLSLGGDLVRRTIIITIDPNMPSPETRSFEIADLKGWVKEHRNELLWSLLVLIRHWVASGRPAPARAQSDSFAAWESTVGGILHAAGVPGSFDTESGKRAAAGGDDDGLAGVLERIWARRGAAPWSVVEILNDTQSMDIGDFVSGSRDWLPSVVLDKLARSEASGRKTFGYWCRNRLGRWVTGSDGHSYVIREAGKDNMASYWKIERTS